MEKKESKFKWKTKNNGTLFGLCLVAVAAFSVMIAAGQVKLAQKEKNEIQEGQLLAEAGGSKEGTYVPQVDAALENALNEPELSLEEEIQGENLEAAASNGILPESEAEEIETEAAQSVVSGTVSSELLQTPELAPSVENSVSAAGILPTVTFDESGTLTWPVAGNVVLDYSMDGSIYFPTLEQYKYNPALVIGSDEGAQVVASARGIVESIGIDEETGTTLTMSLGNGYKLKYGQLQELTVSEGDVVEQGELIGYVSQPTKYYCVEGNNLYFAMTKDETPIDPILYLE